MTLPWHGSKSVHTHNQNIFLNSSYTGGIISSMSLNQIFKRNHLKCEHQSLHVIKGKKKSGVKQIQSFMKGIVVCPCETVLASLSRKSSAANFLNLYGSVVQVSRH
jgi:hypothetical protein